MKEILTSLLVLIIVANASGEGRHIQANQANLTAAAKSITFYVSPKGSDTKGKGTKTSPWKSIRHAAGRAKGIGQTVISLAAGRYRELKPISFRTGVSLVGAGIGKTIIESELPSDYLLNFASPALENGNHRISGFTLDGMDRSLKGGVFAENRHHIELSNVKFINIRDNGAVIDTQYLKRDTTEPALIKGVKVTHCEFVDSAQDFPKFSGGNLEIGGLDGGLISDIKIRSKYGYGIKFSSNGFYRNTIVRNCDIIVREVDKLWGECIAIELWNLGPGCKVYDIVCNTWLSFVNHKGNFATPNSYENLHVYNVRIIDQDGVSSKEGVEIGLPGVKLEKIYIENKGFGIAVWDGAYTNILIQNNIIVNDTYKDNFAEGAGIFLANSTDKVFKDIIIRNNAFQRCAKTVLLSCDSASGFDQITVVNNLILDPKPGSSSFAYRGTNGHSTNSIKTVFFDANLIYPRAEPFNKEAEFSKTLRFGGSLFADPRIKAKGERWKDYFAPRDETSPLIKGGSRLPIDPIDYRPNIGPF